MKHINRFEIYFQNYIELNPHRADLQLQRANNIIHALLSYPDINNSYINHSYQGSTSLGTVIKPSPKVPKFDIDILIFLEDGKIFPFELHIELLYRALKANHIYHDKVSRNTRCITVDYAGELHVDIVPCLKQSNLLFEDQYFIYNRVANQREETSPFAYEQWVKRKMGNASNNQLIKVIKFMKHLRDTKQNFSVKSILLTTLLCSQIKARDYIVDYDQFSDFPKALKTIVNRLTNWLDNHDKMPEISNPVLEDENFNRHWDQSKYENFKSRISLYNEWINDAFTENSPRASILKWQKLLGSNF